MSASPANVLTTVVGVPVSPKLPRIDSVDLLRGIVMIIMALDHSRDFLTNVFFNPEDLTQTNPALFYTRIITHICAPVFMLLAGTGAFLSRARKTIAEVSKFLLTRGIFLVIAEHTLLRFGWESIYGFHVLPFIGGTLWGLGWAMIGLSALVWLPMRWLTIVGAAIVLYHNAFDFFTAQSWGSLRWIWVFLHGGFYGDQQHPTMFVGYSIIPWVGVMALGYSLGLVYRWEAGPRKRFLFWMGLAMTLGFVALRWTNWYGDHIKWSHQKSLAFTVMSFLNTEKYPPSLLFLLMTLGPMMLLLPALESWKGQVANWVVVYGRVPMFYYFAHIYLLHVMALVMSLVAHRALPWVASWAIVLFGQTTVARGFGLPVVYAAWIIAVVALYPACKWYMELKRRSEFWLLGYI